MSKGKPVERQVMNRRLFRAVHIDQGFQDRRDDDRSGHVFARTGVIVEPSRGVEVPLPCLVQKLRGVLQPAHRREGDGVVTLLDLGLPCRPAPGFRGDLVS